MGVRRAVGARTATRSIAELDQVWSRHHAEWRDGAQVVSHWREAADTSAELLRARTRGPWWELLDRAGITLLATREYEHLVMGLSVVDGRPHATFLPLPHPSGMAVDRERGTIHVASTRNPNQVLELAPASQALVRGDAPAPLLSDRPLVPVQARFYPGSLYLHDLAFVDGTLHGNAVGQNAVVRFDADGTCAPVWWPRAIERDGVPDLSRNYLQLNSIAAGAELAGSCFSASCAAPSARRPGHRNYPVDRRGVIFDGGTREPLATGLTRPHSARLRDGVVWVDNSGYGEVGAIADGRFEPIARLPGWTRGLAFHDGVAFVGVSRVIPRFRQYAPGLDVDRSVCGIVALELATGAELARIVWPSGNQVFAIDWLPRAATHGLPFRTRHRAASAPKHLFYSFQPRPKEPTHP